VVIPRQHQTMTTLLPCVAAFSNTHVVDQQLVPADADVSSTLIRERIRSGAAFDDLVYPSVAKYMKENNLLELFM